MLYKAIATFVLLICTSSHAVTLFRPSNDDNGYSYYKWLDNSSDFYLDVSIDNDAKDIISADSLKKLFTLQMRNFVKDMKLVEFSDKDPDIVTYFNKWLYLNLDLRKYNDHNTIYYGSLVLYIKPNIYTQWGDNKEILQHDIYMISTPIANSKLEMNKEIQSMLNAIVQELASDYYWLEQYKEDKKNELQLTPQ